jgi:hypothetical protein
MLRPYNIAHSDPCGARCAGIGDAIPSVDHHAIIAAVAIAAVVAVVAVAVIVITIVIVAIAAIVAIVAIVAIRRGVAFAP